MDDPDRNEPEAPEDAEDPDAVVDDPEGPGSVERPVDRFRRSAGGAVVAAGMLGLRDALEGRPEKEEVTIVNEAPTAPPRDLEVVIDFDHPERSVVVVRHPEDDADESES
jgi:hypothetical protein